MKNEVYNGVTEYIEATNKNMNQIAEEGVSANEALFLGVIHTDLLMLNSTMAFIADRLTDLVELQMKDNKDD